jgi:hypothetical protein
VPLGYTNCHRLCIRKYANLTTPISDILNNSPGKWEWTQGAELGFQKVKKAFTKRPIHQHFHSAKQVILQTDASCFAIAGILNRYDGFGILTPVNFYSRKFCPDEQNCNK